MKIFQDSSLNSILYLFEHQLDDPLFEQTIVKYLSTCDEQTLLQDSPIFGNLLSVLCHFPKYYHQQGFEKGFILLMNHMVIHLNTLNKPILNIDLLINGSHPITIFLLLFQIKQFAAAEICLTHLKVLAKKRTIINLIVEEQLFQKDTSGQFHLSNLSKKCNVDEYRQLFTVIAKNYLCFNLPRQKLIDLLASSINMTELDLYTLVPASASTCSLQQNIFSVLVLFCDLNIIQKHKIMSLLNNPEYRLNLIDFILTQNNLDLAFFNSLLFFYETLFHHHHLTEAQYLQLVFTHPRPGFSIMHQLIFKGYYLGLSCYLNYLEHLLQLEIINISQLKSAYLTTNTSGFNCFYQAVNSFNPNIATLFINYLMRHFNKIELFELVSKGSYNPIHDRYFRPRCSDDKKHAGSNNRMIHELKKRLKDELQAPAQQNSFFLPNTISSTDDSICQELAALGIRT